jgi:hypothetical protein
MPYIITTKRTCRCDGSEHIGSESRRAVSTLEEARHHAYDETRRVDSGTGHRSAWRISSSGGSVGPLPDGTMIEVEPVSWGELHCRSGHEPGDWWGAGDRIIAAYNAGQGHHA